MSARVDYPWLAIWSYGKGASSARFTAERDAALDEIDRLRRRVRTLASQNNRLTAAIRDLVVDQP